MCVGLQPVIKSESISAVISAVLQNLESLAIRGDVVFPSIRDSTYTGAAGRGLQCAGGSYSKQILLQLNQNFRVQI